MNATIAAMLVLAAVLGIPGAVADATIENSDPMPAETEGVQDCAAVQTSGDPPSASVHPECIE